MVKQILRRSSSVLLRAGLRVTPWLVTAGAVAFGSWFFRALIPIASDDRLAAVGIGVVLFRATAAIAAVSMGAFALAAGLEGRWFSANPVLRRRFVGLAALGATGMLVGTFIIVGPLAGFSIAHSLGVVGSAGLLAGLTGWSTWSLRRRQVPDTEPLALGASREAVDWLMRDLGRVKTPAN